MGDLMNFCFNGNNKEFIGTTSYGVIWANIHEKYRLLFEKTSLKSINYMTSLTLFLMARGFVNGVEFLWVPTQSFLYKTYFCVIINKNGSFKQKK